MATHCIASVELDVDLVSACPLLDSLESYLHDSHARHWHTARGQGAARTTRTDTAHIDGRTETQEWSRKLSLAADGKYVTERGML